MIGNDIQRVCMYDDYNLTRVNRKLDYLIVTRFSLTYGNAGGTAEATVAEAAAFKPPKTDGRWVPLILDI